MAPDLHLSGTSKIHKAVTVNAGPEAVVNNSRLKLTLTFYH